MTLPGVLGDVNYCVFVESAMQAMRPTYDRVHCASPNIMHNELSGLRRDGNFHTRNDKMLLTI